VCLDASAVGRTFRLIAGGPNDYPGARLNLHAHRLEGGTVEWRAEPPEPDLGPDPVKPPALTRVDVRGALMQRAGYQGECGGWVDGHDAVCARLCAAFEGGDVLFVVDSPGGAAAGLPENVRRALEVKQQHGRHVTAIVDGMCCSAMLWWVAEIADEVFVPRLDKIGSVGAYAAHQSIAGALAKEGVAFEYFSWPDDGKVAQAPELPLSELGRERGNRDVSIAGEAFAAAVAGSLGLRTGLTVDAIRALRGDVLMGQMAVDAGLADGVATLEDATEYALAIAAGGGDAMNIRAEGAEPDKDMPEDARADGGDDMPEANKLECSGCHMANPEHAKFCLNCGVPMAEGGEDEEPLDAAAPEEPPPSSRRPPMDKDAKARVPAQRTNASLASLLGCRVGASELAMRTAAVRQRQVIDFAAQLTGQSSMDGILGGLKALAEDAAASADLRTKLAIEQRRNNYRERMDLLEKLASANLPGYTRGDLFVDDVSANGVRLGKKPAPVYAEMKLKTLDGLVKNKLANATTNARRSTPFKPDESGLDKSKAAVTAADKQLASLNGRDPERVARARAAMFPDATTTRPRMS